MAADTSDGESGYVEVAVNLSLRKAAQVAAVDALAHAATAAANGKGGSSSGGSPSGSQADTKATTDNQVKGEQPRDSKGKWTSPGEGDAPPGKSGEQKILDKKGQVKNTTSVSGDEGKSTPDYINKTQVGEIKTSKVVNDTKQMRIQRQAANDAGKDHVVDVGTNAKVSKSVEQKSTVVRHDEIGPSK